MKTHLQKKLLNMTNMPTEEQFEATYMNYMNVQD